MPDSVGSGTSAATVGESEAPSDRAIGNLAAFGKLVNYVRFFHPSDEAATTDWTSLIGDTYLEVMAAEDADELARVLEETIQQVAPTVAVYPSGRAQSSTAPPSSGATSVIAWRHVGLGFPFASPSAGVSERTYAPVDAVPDDFPDPVAPLLSDLGSGVSASIPLTLYATPAGTLPLAAEETGWQLEEPWSATYQDGDPQTEATRVAAVMLTWGGFQHFYPYWDVVETDWSMELERSLRAATGTELSTVDVLRGLIGAADDGHAKLLGPGVDTAALPFRWSWIEDELVVTRVLADAPPALRVGDVVVSIDGSDPDRLLADEERYVSAATPQHRRFRSLTAVLEGAPGSAVSIRVRGPDGVEADLTLERSTLGSSVWMTEPRPAEIEEVAPGILYVDLTRVDRLGIQEALERLAEADGVVFDMRRGGGIDITAPTTLWPHLVSQPVSSDRFLVPVYRYPDQGDVTLQDRTWTLEPEEPTFAGEMAFLSDERALSSAETYLALVENGRIGEIVGTTSAGTNGSSLLLLIPGGFQVQMTHSIAENLDGSPHHGVGIEPTMPVERTIAGVAAGADEILEAAIESLTN